MKAMGTNVATNSEDTMTVAQMPLKQLKPLMLAFAIMIGFAVNCDRADAQGVERIVVAGGCFWCVEADFEKVPGVIEVRSGFAGGSVKNPTYKQVTKGGTGHIEVVEIEFNPGKVSRRAPGTHTGGLYLTRRANCPSRPLCGGALGLAAAAATATN